MLPGAILEFYDSVTMYLGLTHSIWKNKEKVDLEFLSRVTCSLSLKLKTIRKCPIFLHVSKTDLNAMLHCIAMGTGTYTVSTRNIYNTGKALYRDRNHVLEFLLHLENNKSCQIMWRFNTSTEYS